MTATTDQNQGLVEQEYKYGFISDIEADAVPAGLNEDIIRLISTKKGEPEFMLAFRLKAYRHWLTMSEPTWHNLHYGPIDYQSIVYYSAPRPPEKRVHQLEELECGMSSMIDVALPVVLSAQVARIDAGYVKTKNRQGEHRWFPLRRLAACWVDDDEITMFVLANDLKEKGMLYLA